MTASTVVRRVPDVLTVRATRTPDQVAHDDGDHSMTFAMWDAWSNEIAGGLVAAGVESDDRVLMPITNRHAVAFAAVFVGILRAGAICVPLNTRLARPEVDRYADYVGARWAITDSSEVIGHLDLSGAWSVDALPSDPASCPDQASLAVDGDACIISTSGTTGRPKGVVFSHAELVERLGDGTATTSSRSILHALPFTGFGGCHGLMLSSLRIGNTVYTQPAFDPGGFLELVQSCRPDSVHLVPAMLRLILDHPRVADYDVSSVKWIITGTAPVPHDSVRRSNQLWPHARVINFYGMTESSTGVQTRNAASVLKPGCVGRPSEPGSVEIRSGDGEVLPPGEIGEVWTKAVRPRRYWNDPDATASTWQGGWLRTGDLGYFDDDGDLIISGRSKELIIRGGYNISPVEIEDVLHDHPGVLDAAVVGIPHDVLGEDVAAAVVARSSDVTIDELREWCSTRLANNKVPRVIELFESLPYNQNRKVVKAELEPMLRKAAERARSDSPTAARPVSGSV